MKQEDIDDINVGLFQIGPFNIGIQLPVHQEEVGDYFQVLVTEQGEYLYYIHLNDDERFGIFKHLQVFSRKIIEQDMVAYNAHVSSVFHKIAMPTFLLHRNAIAALFDTCTMMAKKMKKDK